MTSFFYAVLAENPDQASTGSPCTTDDLLQKIDECLQATENISTQAIDDSSGELT